MKKPHPGGISRSGAVMVGLAGFEPTRRKRTVSGGNGGKFPVCVGLVFLGFPRLR